jgi:hypothetical protein
MISFRKQSDIFEYLNNPVDYNNFTSGVMIEQAERFKRGEIESAPSISYDKMDGRVYITWRNGEGVYHRENDLPAIIYEDGSKAWWTNGKIAKRPNDLPAVIQSNGIKKWFTGSGGLETFIRGEDKDGNSVDLYGKRI